MVGLGYPGLPITQLRGIMSKIREQLKEDERSLAETAYFYKLKVKFSNEDTWSPEAEAAAVNAVIKHNVLELEIATDGHGSMEYAKKVNERAQGFSGLTTMAYVLLLTGAVTREELNSAIDEMLKDTKTANKIRKC